MNATFDVGIPKTRSVDDRPLRLPLAFSRLLHSVKDGQHAQHCSDESKRRRGQDNFQRQPRSRTGSGGQASLSGGPRPSGHASFHVGVEAGPDMPTVYDVFTQQTTLDHTRQLVGENLSLVPANIDLAATEVELAGTQGREFFLRNAMQHWKDQNRFDYVVMDCPPSLGILTINALTAVGEVFIPLQPHFFALQGLSKLFETTALVTRRLNRELRVTGIMMCLYESGTRLAADVTEDLKQFLDSSDGDTPWASARISRARSVATSNWLRHQASVNRSSTTLRTPPAPRTTSRWLRKF